MLPGSVLYDYDVLLVRGLHDPTNSRLWEAAATLPNLTLVYDLDDDIWAYHPDTMTYRYWNDDRRLRAEQNIQLAHVVTTPTEALAGYLQQLNPNVAVLPNTVPRKLLQTLRPQRTHNKFVVGWQGAYQHLHDIELIMTPLFRFMLRHLDVELHLWGVDRFADLPTGLTNRVRCYGWTASVWGHYFNLDMDIGLAPLDMSDPFNESRSDIRAREYAALGIPCIASGGQTYGYTIKHGVTGLLAYDPTEWEEYLELLYADKYQREFLAEMGRKKAGESYTTEGNAIEWERVYVAARNRNVRVS
jgi:glycosyltransferase involved in cell wall biosynthesis